MLQFTIIGNLGADARIEEANGRKFVSFSIGHNESWQDADGKSHDRTQWISCALNGDGGNLLPYLVKGRTVFVQGRGSTRVYSSPKEHRMVAGLNLSVDRLELIGSQPDQVPRQLFDADGVMHRVNKAYYVSDDEAKALGVSSKKTAMLQTQDGRLFEVQNHGWITPIKQEVVPEADSSEPADAY